MVRNRTVARLCHNHPRAALAVAAAFLAAAGTVMLASPGRQPATAAAATSSVHHSSAARGAFPGQGSASGAASQR